LSKPLIKITLLSRVVEPAIAVNAYRETGVNVLEVMSDLRLAMQELRDGPLQRSKLSITQVYDEN
jgi:multidrug efflux pump subunit AcrB